MQVRPAPLAPKHDILPRLAGESQQARHNYCLSLLYTKVRLSIYMPARPRRAGCRYDPMGEDFIERRAEAGA
jgi:hypothetical protein